MKKYWCGEFFKGFPGVNKNFRELQSNQHSRGMLGILRFFIGFLSWRSGILFRPTISELIFTSLVNQP